MMNYTPRGPYPGPGSEHWRPEPDRPYYWERMPGEAYRPAMHHQKHRDKYFYTVLFLDNYFDEQCPLDPPRGATIYCDVTETFGEGSPLEWKKEDPNILVIHHRLKLPVTLEIWDEENKPLIYVPIIKENVEPICVGLQGCKVVDFRTIEINFTGKQKPELNEKFLLGMKQVVDFQLDPSIDLRKSDAVKTLQEFMAVPKMYPKGLALVFRRNSLEGLFDLISDFDETYFHSMDQSQEIKYLVKKSCYKDLHFSTIFTDNLQDVINIIDIANYKIEYSWQDHKKYRDQYQDYAEKYGYK